MTPMEQTTLNWKLPFFTIWTGQAVSLVGSRLVQFALVWWLTESTGSATVLATASLVALLPGIVLGPFAGALVDRWNRRRVMIVADSFVALISAWLAYLFWTGTVSTWHVYVAMLGRSLGGAFHWPSMQASTSLMVPREHLSRVAGMNQTLQGAMGIAAPPLGAILLALLPVHGIMGIDVATAAVAVVSLFLTAIPEPPRAEVSAGVKPSVWQDLRAGFRYVRGWPGLIIIVALAMVINFVVNPAFTLMPLLVTDHFRGGALQLGWLQSGWGVGMLVGGVLLSVWGGFRRRVYTSMAGLVLEGLAIIVIGLAPANGFQLALGALFVAGLMNPLINGPLLAILQVAVAPDMQGRVFTLVSSLSAAMMPLSLAVAGPVADAIGVRTWYVIGGAVFSLLGAVTFFVPAIANIEQQSRSGQEDEPVAVMADAIAAEG